MVATGVTLSVGRSALPGAVQGAARAACGGGRRTGVVQGVVTQASLLEAMAGDIPEESEPNPLACGGDGYLIAGSAPIREVLA